MVIFAVCAKQTTATAAGTAAAAAGTFLPNNLDLGIVA